MNLLQDYCRSFATADQAMAQLEATRHIASKRHPKYQNLIQFKYDMIDSPMGDPIVQLCRGIILDSDDNWNVVAWPFHKFFNYEEGHAAKIDWGSARVQEKLDGSLCIMYHYDGKWHVATSGNPDAGGDINGLGFSFAQLFWKTWESQIGWTDNEGLDKDLTFLWELTSQYNRIVVAHKEPKITLIGVRNRVTGQESPVYTCGVPVRFPVVKHFSISTLESVLESFESMSGVEQEGYVVVDKDFNRVKIKHPQYVALHHLKGESAFPTPRNALAVVRQGETSEILNYYPEWAPIFTEVETRYHQLIFDLEVDYKSVCNRIPPVPAEIKQTDKRAYGLFRKEFASLATKSRVPSVLFSLLDQKHATVKECLLAMQIDHLATILKLDEIKINPLDILGNPDAAQAPTL